MIKTISGWALDAPMVPKSMCEAPFTVYWPRKAEATSWEIASLADQLKSIAALDEGWDGYGAASVDSRAIAFAESLVSVMRVRPEFVLPSSSGTVLLEWEGPFGRASLELGADTFGFYTAPNVGEPIMLAGKSDELDAENLEAALATITSTFRPQSVENGDWLASLPMFDQARTA